MTSLRSLVGTSCLKDLTTMVLVNIHSSWHSECSGQIILQTDEDTDWWIDRWTDRQAETIRAGPNKYIMGCTILVVWDIFPPSPNIRYIYFTWHTLQHLCIYRPRTYLPCIDLFMLDSTWVICEWMCTSLNVHRYFMKNRFLSKPAAFYYYCYHNHTLSLNIIHRLSNYSNIHSTLYMLNMSVFKTNFHNNTLHIYNKNILKLVCYGICIINNYDRH